MKTGKVKTTKEPTCNLRDTNGMSVRTWLKNESNRFIMSAKTPLCQPNGSPRHALFLMGDNVWVP